MQGTYNQLDAFQLFGLYFRRLVQKNDITEFNLPDDKIFNVFLVNPFPGKVVAAGEFALQAQGVHYGSDAVQAADAILGVHAAQAGNGADGLRDGFRFADAAGFDDDIIETLHPHDFAYLLYQVRFQRTTDATVLKRNEAFVFLAHNAAFLDEVCIDVYLAYVIDDNRESDTLFIGENMVYQGRFASAQITGKEQYGNFFCCHIVLKSLLTGSKCRQYY